MPQVYSTLIPSHLLLVQLEMVIFYCEALSGKVLHRHLVHGLYGRRDLTLQESQ